MVDYITVIGGGLAGSEVKFSPAHSNKNFAEIVCSNSFKSDLLTNACGLLKEELRILGSELIKVADETKVPARTGACGR